jgi:thioredoxin reductase (NADPH)
MSETLYDVIIIGAGPAGLTSGIYTSRHNYKTLVLEGNKVGGKALDAIWIENYPGFPEGINGPDLMAKMEEQAKKFGAEIKLGTVYGLSKYDEVFMASTRSGEVYQGRSLIIATGISRKSLNVKNENEFKGRGVSYCGVCDGPFFEGKNVAVIGAGHEAVHDVELLSKTSKKVYTIPSGKGYSEAYPELKHLENDPKVVFIYGANITEVCGTDFVESIKLDGAGLKAVKVEGVFFILEHVSTSAILADFGLETDAGGCVLVDRDQKTSVSGLFAAGDCCCKGFQVVTATGMGASAALSAMRYVKQLK